MKVQIRFASSELLRGGRYRALQHDFPEWIRGAVVRYDVPCGVDSNGSMDYTVTLDFPEVLTEAEVNEISEYLHDGWCRYCDGVEDEEIDSEYEGSDDSRW
jgi:hypothetical protein